MRYMLIMEAPESMAVGGPDAPPTEEIFEAMSRYNTDLVEAGVLLAAEGLAPSSDGFVVTHDDEGASVTDGPFTEAKELVAGLWILEVASREEAVQWARRCPIGPGVTLQVRRIAEMADLQDLAGGGAPAEVLDAEATLRRRVAEREQV